MLPEFKNIKVHKLLKDIQDEKHIAIYGCGEYGKSVQEVLSQKGYEIDYYIVSRNIDGENFINGKPVYTIEKCEERLNEEKTQVIIAVGNIIHEREMIYELKKRDIHKYICIRRYMVYTNMVHAYIGKSKEEYLSGVEEWKIENGGCEIEQQGTEKIAFIVGNYSGRVYKIISALSKKGCSAYIYIGKAVEDTDVYNISQLQDIQGVTVIVYSSVEELIYRLLHTSHRCIYFFAKWGCYDEMFILMQQKNMFPTIIIDIYDTINGMHIREHENWDLQLMLERFCIEHCDGLCAREYAFEYLKEKLGFKLPDHCLFYMDYFVEEDSVEEDFVNVDSESELSLCYVGGIVTEREQPEYPLACFMELAKMCEENHCHLHIYPAESWYGNKFAEYIEFDRNNKFFHFHKSVPTEMLQKEIAKYDYGIHPVIRDYDKGDRDITITSHKLTYCMVNKFSDYLAAGLPIIACVPVKLADEFEKREMLIKWAIEDYDFDELRRRKRKMKENVFRNRHLFSMDEHIGELVDFVNKVSG